MSPARKQACARGDASTWAWRDAFASDGLREGDGPRRYGGYGEAVHVTRAGVGRQAVKPPNPPYRDASRRAEGDALRVKGSPGRCCSGMAQIVADADGYGEGMCCFPATTTRPAAY